MQANFAAIYLRYTGKSFLEKKGESSLFACLDSINEEDEELGSLGASRGGQASSLTGISRYYRSKEGNGLGSRITDLPTSNHFADGCSLQRKDLFGAKNSGSLVLSHFQAPQHQSILLPIWYTAPIESKVMRRMPSRILSEKVLPFSRGLLALAPEVRGISKEATTTQGLPALPAEAQSKAAHACCHFFNEQAPRTFFQLNQHCHFRRLRLLSITRFRLQHH